MKAVCEETRPIKVTIKSMCQTLEEINNTDNYDYTLICQGKKISDKFLLNGEEIMIL